MANGRDEFIAKMRAGENMVREWVAPVAPHDHELLRTVAVYIASFVYQDKIDDGVLGAVIIQSLLAAYNLGKSNHG